MSSLFATCTPNSHPRDDGSARHGFQINVLDEQLTIHATIDLADWESFRPASAGHRLIEVGYMISPGVDRADLNGWQPTAHGYTVPVVSLDEVDRG
jgi:hypothetical protein